MNKKNSKSELLWEEKRIMEAHTSKMAIRKGLCKQHTASTRGSNKLGLLKERKARITEVWGLEENGR